MKKLYTILSPDGFSINMGGHFKSKKKALAYFQEWKKRFMAQGYYSSPRGRIDIEDLEYYCKWIIQ